MPSLAKPTVFIKMNAKEFANSLEYPVVFFASAGNPTGIEVAILPETDLHFELSAIEVDANGRWNGIGEPRDWNGNTISKITVHNYSDIWREQAKYAGYLKSEEK